MTEHNGSMDVFKSAAREFHPALPLSHSVLSKVLIISRIRIHSYVMTEFADEFLSAIFPPFFFFKRRNFVRARVPQDNVFLFTNFRQ